MPDGDPAPPASPASPAPPARVLPAAAPMPATVTAQAASEVVMPATGKGDPAAGREVFNGTCAHCHGPDAVVADRRINLRRLQEKYGDAWVQPGHFVGNTDLAAGQWDLVIELSRQDERLFRSKNRVVLK